MVVDDLFDGSGFYHGPYAERAREVGARNQHLWCHLTSTTSLDELHDFAALLGLSRRSFDRDHYDLTPPRRSLALELGAVEVTADEMYLATRYDLRGLPRPEWGVV
ncbi:MAG: DUF4031 domain-containing protein [Chloroflexi bacterium]|nr:DUF4031 domain-containing protein [Chloroflexota bacterium]